jgi:hypothetical protein
MLLERRWEGKKKSVALVRKGTIPTERPPLVSEVSANFSNIHKEMAAYSYMFHIKSS